jgi:hypothetical protein
MPSRQRFARIRVNTTNEEDETPPGRWRPSPKFRRRLNGRSYPFATIDCSRTSVRCRRYCIVRSNPCSSSVVGDQPNSSWTSDMSGRRRRDHHLQAPLDKFALGPTHFQHRLGQLKHSKLCRATNLIGPVNSSGVSIVRSIAFTLALVVAVTQPDRMNTTPVILPLGMLGIADSAVVYPIAGVRERDRESCR